MVGGLLYYARAVDCTVLTALSSTTSKHASTIEGTEAKVEQRLDYVVGAMVSEADFFYKNKS